MELYSAVENEAVKIPAEWVGLGIIISGVTQPIKMEAMCSLSYAGST